MALVSRPCYEGDEGQVRKGREDQDCTAMFTSAKQARCPRTQRTSWVTLSYKEGIGFYLPRPETLGLTEIPGAAPSVED